MACGIIPFFLVRNDGFLIQRVIGAFLFRVLRHRDSSKWSERQAERYGNAPWPSPRIGRTQLFVHVSLLHPRDQSRMETIQTPFRAREGNGP